VLGVAAIASLITALVINSQAIGYVRGRLSYRMSTYIQTQSSISIMDAIQTRYQCCGENLWLDWQLYGLGSSTSSGVSTGTGTVTGTGTGTGTVVGTGTGTGTGTGSIVGKCKINAELEIFMVSNRKRTPPSSFRFPIKSFDERCSSTTTSVNR
jgi:hypothetical protein